MRHALNGLLILTMLGVLLIIQTNSRSSILVKEAVFVGGSAVLLLAGAVILGVRGVIACRRISFAMVLAFVLLLAWLVFRHFGGVQSVNGTKYLYGFLALGGLAFVIAGFVDSGSRNLIIWVLLTAAAVISVYSILQSLGLNIFSWDASITHSSRSSGTMGNANLLGSFSMVMIPVGTGFLLGRHRLSKFRIPAAGVFALLCLFAVVSSKTRGSLLGIAVLAVSVPLIPALRRDRKRLAAILLLLLVLLGLSVVVLWNRVEELTQMERGTLQVRNLIWSGSLRMWLGNPVLGYGPGSFQIVFPGYRNPDYFLLGVSHNTLHAHCEYLEILGDSGLVGLLLWGFLAVSVMTAVRKGRRGNAEDGGGEGKLIDAEGWMFLGIAGGILALLAEALVSVALRWPPSAFMMALLTGLLLACIPFRPCRPSAAVRYGVSAAMAGAAVFLFVTAMPKYCASMRAGKELFRGKDIFLTSIQQDVDNAVSAAMEWNSRDRTEAADMAINYYSRARQLADSSLKWCRMCVETDPDELGGWYALGSAYVSSSRLYQQISPPLTVICRQRGIEVEDEELALEYINASLAAYDSLRRRAPDYAEIHNNLALVWLNLGNADSALAHMRRAWDLHAHSRAAYADKIRILNCITRSPDGVYLKWLCNIYSLERVLEGGVSETVYGNISGPAVFDFGTTLYGFPGLEDSLAAELKGLLVSSGRTELARMTEIVDLQLARLEEGAELAGMYLRDDTAAVMDVLRGMDREVMRHLPVHSALYGIILAERGDPAGIDLTLGTFRYIFHNGIDDLLYFPVDAVTMMEVMNEAIAATGIDTQDERLLLYRHLSSLLELDRRIFEVVVFMESSMTLEEAYRGVRDRYGYIWEEIGGPMYSYMEYNRLDTVPPLMAPEGILHRNWTDLSGIVAADTMDADRLLMEMEWLFIFYSASFAGVPHYSSMQSAAVVNMLADDRDRLTVILGENETQYRVGLMFGMLEEARLLNVQGEFRGYIESLRGDLTLGRITRPDLP